MEEIKKHMRELEEKLLYHSKKYYDDDAPEISDYEYDMMLEELKRLEAEHPELASPSSPTRRVAGHVAEKFEKVTHEVMLGSLTDVFDKDGLYDFDRRVRETSPGCHMSPSAKSTDFPARSNTITAFSFAAQHAETDMWVRM